ncbi:TIGR03960 family B12-binding radical SAM protein [Desulfurobacterium atlanticum]|uniref:Radical SAM-linked protein/radical SAM family uncharacterized protein n=1 Tax=Desulfurobacterium atlanticum TaxID=240169 RepID=A0A238Z1C1_9BACT|nr:TIGR03960 family B12-binding radical SAM protein [Desulfurobacterium atlanticum]SNR76659.1 radical SAM-linked protein/radical SAM family uncharacterized protein [Desulfurobacterium atlanticum]
MKNFVSDLIKVSKPASYLPLEVNLPKISFKERDIRFVLSYPDFYEIGMSHFGGKIIYHVLNNLTDFALCHRVYLPKPDMQKFLKEKDIPLYAIESLRSVKDYDVLAFSLLTELVYTNVLKILELSKVPLKREERKENDPVVLAGGTCTFNPVPLSPFIDIFVIGDGEEVLIEIASLLKEKKDKGWSRQDFLEKARHIEGVYIPAFGKYRVKRRVFHSFDVKYFPVKPVVPSVETVHDRIVVEAVRGCLRGCRYCQAGFTYRPYRERSVKEVVFLIDKVFESTGYEEASLLALSISDHSKFNDLIPEVISFCYQKMIGLSLPSMRVKGFNPDLATQLLQLKKTGFTIAPEAATERLRKVINKDLTNDDIFSLVEGLFERGWSKLKFYFMIGLPTERDEDIEAITELLYQVHKISRKYKGRKHLAAGFSIFVPKPFTPFQWERFISIDEAKRKIDFIKKNAPRSFKLRFHTPEISFLEAVLTRGDEKVADAVYEAYKLGAMLDGWDEYFEFSIWEKAFEKAGVNLDKVFQGFDIGEELPWDFVDGGVSKKFLLRELEKAYREEKTPDCRIVGCHGCGSCTSYEIKKIKELPIPERIEFNVPPKPKRDFPLKSKIALFFEKRGYSRYLSLLDLTRVFTRAFRRAGIPLRYQGKFNPHPRFTILLGIPTGVESLQEIVEIELSEEFKMDESTIELLNQFLPAGLRFLSWKEIERKESLLRKVKVEYKISGEIYKEKAEDILKADRLVGRKGKEVSVKEFVENFMIEDGVITLTLKVLAGRTLNVQDFLFWLGKDFSSVSVERKVMVVE